MTEFDFYLFGALVVLLVYLCWSTGRQTRKELARQKALDKKWLGQGFEVASISPQIERLRHNYLGAVRAHRSFPCARKERIVTARCALSQFSFFRKFGAGPEASPAQQTGEIARF
jgi:hypothetical protein